MAKSRTQKALEMVEGGVSVRAAANKYNLKTQTIYQAINSRRGRKICECCGQVIRKHAGG